MIRDLFVLVAGFIFLYGGYTIFLRGSLDTRKYLGAAVYALLAWLFVTFVATMAQAWISQL